MSREAVRVGALPTEETAARLASLTPREREVLELVQLGLSNAEVARHLFISDSTVRKHLENAFLKLDVHSRTQAAAVMNAARVLPPMPEDRTERPMDLPRYLTSFVGRRRELQQIHELFGKARLLTLTGSGGVGKTRLALQVADDLSGAGVSDAAFVELGSIADPSLVPQSVASALGVREEAGSGLVETLIRSLRPKPHLLILDNCEHVVAGCADLAHTLLTACPSLLILATSRQVLRIDGETVYSVPTLPVPDADRQPPVEELTKSEAVKLFLERASAAQPTFELTEDNASLLVEICRRLDGIPLAIELAAALVRTRSLELIASGLDDRFGLLVAGSRTATKRQQTLRATVDWSFDLLTDPERRLLRRLSVFVGGFSAEAVQAVCPDDYVDVGVIDLLTSLVDKSLVLLDGEGTGGRYRLLETVRDYSLERLIESGEAEDVRTRHRDWYLGTVERARHHLFGGPEQAEWLARLDREHDNLRAALDWTRAHGPPDAGLRLASGMWRFWEIRGYLAEGRKWLEPALSAVRGEVTEVRANALTGAGVLACMQGDYAASFALHEQSLALHRELGNAPSIAYALSNLGNMAAELEDYERARAFHEEAAVLHRRLGNDPEQAGASLHLAEIVDRLGDEVEARALFEETLTTLEELADRKTAAGEHSFVRWLLGYGLSLYASTALRRGDLVLARELALRALSIYHQLQDGREGARILSLLADVTNAQGDPAAAVSLLLEALATRQGMGDRPGIAATLERLAAVAAPIDPARATRLLGAAEALREQMGTPPPAKEAMRRNRLRSSLQAALGVRRYDDAFESGRRSTLSQAVEDASAMTAQPPIHPL